MKHVVLIIVLITLSSCGSSFQIKKKRSTTPVYSVKTDNSKKVEVKPISSTTTDLSYHAVVNTAKNYIGTPYRSGGTTSAGMDCSGLVITSFKTNGIDLPRRSSDQANAGKTVNKTHAQVGDLIFFNTSGNGISHVGIIESIKNGEIYFIHSSSSKGVMISSLENSYWKPRFVKIVRVN